jgi:hypothetical protein
MDRVRGRFPEAFARMFGREKRLDGHSSENDIMLTKRFLLPIAFVLLWVTPAIAEIIKCANSNGCQAKFWNPTTQTWGDPVDVPNGTIVDTRYAIGWGTGWQPVT